VWRGVAARWNPTVDPVTPGIGSLLVAVGPSDFSRWSYAGMEWFDSTLSGVTKIMRALACASNGLFMAVGDDGYGVTTTDGVTWTGVGAPVLVTTRLNGLATFSTQSFYACGETGDPYGKAALAFTSDGGSNWSEFDSGTALSASLNAIAVNEALQVWQAVGPSGPSPIGIVIGANGGEADDAILRATSGIPESESLGAIVASGDGFLVGGTGNIYRTADGDHYAPWTAMAIPADVTGAVTGIAASGDLLWASVDGQGILASADAGATWSWALQIPLPFNAAAGAGSAGLLCGASGIIFESRKG